MPLRGGRGAGGRTPNGKYHVKFPFWLLEPLPNVDSIYDVFDVFRNEMIDKERDRPWMQSCPGPMVQPPSRGNPRRRVGCWWQRLCLFFFLFLLFCDQRNILSNRSRMFFNIPWNNRHVGQRGPTIFSKYPQLKLCLNHTFNFPNIYWQQKFSNLLIRFIPTWECPARTSWLELGEPDDEENKKNQETKQFQRAPTTWLE